MFTKKALMSLLAVILLTGAGLPFGNPAQSSGQPPLQGIFADNFILYHPPAPAPTGSFTDLAGATRTLADFQGQTVLLNFWATWCAPCIEEMPSIDQLQTELGPEGLKVVAVSVDRGGANQVIPFQQKYGWTSVEFFLDPKGLFSREFEHFGLPTTYIIDPQGQMVGVLKGPAEWDTEAAKALIRHYLPAPGGAELIRTGG